MAVNQTKQPELQLHNLPVQFTSFIGRGTERAQIKKLLADPACRLLTLTGPGGIGKTRLALQSAADLAGSFAQGACFVPLQGIHSADFLISAIANAAGLSFSGQLNPRAQMLNYLQNKELLLLLDNFEQLVEQGGPALLHDILAAAPAIKLLVTSREILNLQEEWLCPVRGLPVPAATQTDAVETDNAVQLFVVRARQVSPDFSLADQADEVLRICQLVEGIPLAVELAASWTKNLSCQAIAAEIQQNIDFLRTSLRNVADRHRSMAAVFDTSWQRLSDSEQQAFQRLSVFQGGFRREAAEHVANTTLSHLAALLDKSLLRRDPHDRYQIHELLRQYAGEQLEAQAEAVAQTRQVHCAWYAEFLYQRREAIESGDQQATVTEIELELDNVRAAWQWAIAHTRVAEIQKMSQTFTVFCHYQSRYLEAANTFERARACLEAQPPTRETALALADVLVRLGWFYIRLGKFEAAQAALTQSRTRYDQLGAAPVRHSGADPLPPLSILATIRGDYAEAVTLGQLAQQINAARNDPQNLAFAYYVLTSATLAQGDYDTARQYARQACETATHAGNRWFLAYCLNEWGNVARAMANYAEAERHFQASYQIREAFNDPEGMAVALNLLGEMAIRRADIEAAQRRYQQSLTLYQKINDSGGLALAHFGLGQTACALQDYPAAAQNFRQALAIADEIEFRPLICSMLIGIGDFFLKTGLEERGLELLALGRHHPASDQETRDRAGKLLNERRTRVGAIQFDTAVRRGRQLNLDDVVTDIQQTLAGLPASLPAPFPTQPLLEPLTERELEVLQLMAVGRSNREIGDELVLAIGSVKWYASQIYGKLQVKNRTEAAARARQLGLIL